MSFQDWKWKLKRRVEEGTKKVNIEGEEVLIKKSKILPLPFAPKEWKQIQPPVDEYGNMNWFNFLTGGRANLVKLITIMVIVAMVFFAFNEMVFNNECVQLCAKYGEFTNNSGMIMPTCPAN